MVVCFDLVTFELMSALSLANVTLVNFDCSRNHRLKKPMEAVRQLGALRL